MLRVFGEPGDLVVATVSFYPPAPTVWAGFWFPYQGRTYPVEWRTPRAFRDWLDGGCVGLRIPAADRAAFHVWAAAVADEIDTERARCS